MATGTRPPRRSPTRCCALASSSGAARGERAGRGGPVVTAHLIRKFTAGEEYLLTSPPKPNFAVEPPKGRNDRGPSVYNAFDMGCNPERGTLIHGLDAFAFYGYQNYYSAILYEKYEQYYRLRARGESIEDGNDGCMKACVDPDRWQHAYRWRGLVQRPSLGNSSSSDGDNKPKGPKGAYMCYVQVGR
jgi:hypothetical protein